MDGFWFYWFMWLFIIWNSFFNENNKQKEIWKYIAPILLISTSILVPIYSFQLRISWLIVAITIFSLIARLTLKKKIHLYIISLLISGGYLSIHYFIYFEPVWLFVSPLIIIISITGFISIMLLNNPSHRLIALIAGLIQGDFLLWFILWNESHPYSKLYIIGDFFFLDLLALSILIIFIWNSLESITSNVKNKWFPDYKQNQPGQKNVTL